MVNPSTESILHQMTNLAMDIAMDHYAGDYVLPASPLSDVSKNDLYDFERDVFKNFKKSDNELLFGQCVAGSMGTARGCPGCPPTDLCKKDSYMGAASCDNCGVCLKKHPKPQQQFFSADGGPTPSSSSSSEVVKPKNNNHSAPAETTMDISWCQFEGCEFDTTDNSYLEIYDWIFYADRYALTDENREKVQKAFQMVPPSEVTGYVAEPPRKLTATAPAAPKTLLTAYRSGDDDVVIPVPSATAADQMACRIKAEIKCESDDDYLWTSDNHMQPIILKAEPNADIQQITELDHSYLQTTNVCSSAASSAAVSPVKHHHPGHHLNVDLLGLVTPPPSRSQSSEEEEIDVVNDVDSWDAPTMADIMKRGIVVKKRDPPVTKLKNAVKRRYNRTSNSSTFPPMPPPPPKKLCNAGGGGGLSLMDRYKKSNWKDVPPAIPIARETRPAAVPAVKSEPLDDDDEECVAAAVVVKPEIKSEPPSDDGEDDCYDDDDDEDDEDNDMMMYDMDADFESLMKNEPDDLFDEDFDDDENDADWDKVFRRSSADSSSSRGCRYGGGKPSFGGGASSSSTCDGRKKKKKKAATSGGAATTKSSKHRHHHHHHHHQQQHSLGVGKKIKYEGGTGGGGYSYKTKLMDPVKRALHNDLEKSRRVETSMLFMNLSMQVSFLDDNRKIPSKLSILRGAKRECDIQLLDERRLVSEKHAMQQKQRMLRERLFELRREQYHRRYGKTATAATTVRHKQQQ